jgi:hypothetical protein
MTFPLVMMQPWFAVAGLAAVGLAVWMHLYQRVASRRMPVSSLRLVPETPRVARSRRRMRRWPLFLLRALGVLLLGAAFARPGLPGGGQPPVGGREAVVFVLDRSGSMAMRSPEGLSAWEEARKRVQSRLAGLHPGSRVRLFCFPPAETGGDWSNPSAMRKVVAGLTPNLAGGRPFEALREAAEALARFRSDMPQSLEIVGDLQRPGWDEIGTLTLPEELRVSVSQTGDPEAVNRGLSLRVRGSDQLRCGAVVKVGGGTTPVIVRDRVGADGEAAEREIPLLDEVLELPYRAVTNGWVRREVAFRQATDGLPEDDRLFDAFLVTPEIPVYLLEPHPERDVFLQTTFFLHQALRPTAGNAAEDSRFLPRVVPVKDAIEALRAVDGQEAVVVVPPLANWPAELPAAVEAFLRQGGGVVFFAGPDLQPSAYATAWRDLLPALPGEVLSVEADLALSPMDETHPIWGGFGEELRQAMRKVQLKKRFVLAVGEGAEVTARYADEVPLVVQRQVGSGRAIFVNTSPDRAWGDWSADGALFVPTVHMLMSSVLTSTSQTLRNSPGAGIVGVPFDVRIDPASVGVPLRAGDRALRADEQGWVRGLCFDHPGLFDILTEDGRSVRPVAVNFPPDESRREFFRPAILQRQIEARRRVSGSAEEAPRINLASESGWWRWILAVLAIVWLAEPWLAFQPAPDTGRKGVES